MDFVEMEEGCYSGVEELLKGELFCHAEEFVESMSSFLLRVSFLLLLHGIVLAWSLR